ncbi:tRNA preQ1(34) S-adenosylmethionine ribosyltransferase-isomerase QueA [candidate division KSB1 bacterium]|nr:tRNA preQ1(34) S-adenosylmethionine ribosyltransferase-isomerase QueA [candidate division KSB1 bacterium]
MTNNPYLLSDYDYHLPETFIAQSPFEPRDHCKLMQLNRKTGEISHHKFYEIIDFLNPSDVLVLNETRVLSARLIGRKKTGAKIEVLLLKQIDEIHWEALAKPGRRFRKGNSAIFGDSESTIQVVDELDEGIRLIKTTPAGEKFLQLIEKIGHIPLPPYIKRPDQPADHQNYQTVYADKAGSVAAPTAGLHFTVELIDSIQKKGIPIIPLTLHVGLGTFRPVEKADIREHRMHAEYYHLSAENARLINEAKAKGGRIVAVGTTSVRTLETLATNEQTIQPGFGWSKLFIYPGYQFKIVDAIITNFHLPKSSLLMMISAFTSLPILKLAYQQAMENQYRFFSYGDAMFIS